MASLALSSSSTTAYNKLKYGCQQDPLSREVWQHYSQLLALRQTSRCSKEYSIETCPGFKESKPYTQYLKQLELGYHCSGFCYEANLTLTSAKSTVKKPSTAPAQNNSTLPAKAKHSHLLQNGGVVLLSIGDRLARIVRSANGTVHRSVNPPALFSKSKLKVSCHSAAARDLLIFSRGTAHQYWYMGCSLIALATVMSAWEWTNPDSK